MPSTPFLEGILTIKRSSIYNFSLNPSKWRIATSSSWMPLITLCTQSHRNSIFRSVSCKKRNILQWAVLPSSCCMCRWCQIFETMLPIIFFLQRIEVDCNIFQWTHSFIINAFRLKKWKLSQECFSNLYLVTREKYYQYKIFLLNQETL